MTSAAAGPSRSFFDRFPRPAIVFALFLGNVAAWSIYSAFAHEGSALHQDVTEAYAWGREFQLGYYKHPPFWAWIAGIWFSFMPHRDWAFYLLALLNANIGLLGAWKLAGRFASGDKRVGATLLLLLTPFYTFLSFKYNANSIFLSLWPWTAYFFARSIDETRLVPSVVFGAMAAAALLSKYYAAILLASCFFAALVHPGRRRYFASPRPYLALGVCALLVAPHVWWLVNTGFLPLRYIAGEMAYSFPVSVLTSFEFLGGCIALQGLMLGAVLLIKPFSRSNLAGTIRERWRHPRFRFMAILALGPVLLTAIAGPLLHLRLDTNMAIGIFCLVPLLLLEVSGTAEARRIRRLSWGFVLALTVGALCISPFAANWAFRQGQPTSIDPRREAADEATWIWHQLTSTPLAIVTGNSDYASAVSFYSEDRPHQFIDFNFDYSPWLTREEVSRQGMLAICLKSDSTCLASSAAFATATTTQVEIDLRHEFAGQQTSPTSFVLTIVPPRR